MKYEIRLLERSDAVGHDLIIFDSETEREATCYLSPKDMKNVNLILKRVQVGINKLIEE